LRAASGGAYGNVDRCSARLTSWMQAGAKKRLSNRTKKPEKDKSLSSGRRKALDTKSPIQVPALLLARSEAKQPVIPGSPADGVGGSLFAGSHDPHFGTSMPLGPSTPSAREPKIR
ncbi:MAG TPA: hypothetical protein VHO91_07330, partial [Rhodopila sp.]|nr:hypothetical protein [Rhodopila sp.]